jgi:glycosyltransferase involved in cell wall biosynthesis/SAM-dependent methyltransferase
MIYKKDILILSHDVVDTRMAGPGIRYWELARVLAREFRVTLAVPGNTSLAADSFALQTYAPDRPQQLVRLAQEADAVLAYGYAVRDWPFLADLSVPWIADVYVPEPTEALAWYTGGSFAQRQAHYENVYRALEPLARHADFFLCAHERQRDFWLGLLTAYGRLGPSVFAKDPTLRRLVDIVPFGLPSLPARQKRPALKGQWPGIAAEDPVILWGGGLWDWLDPLTLIRAMTQVGEQEPRARLVFPGTRHPNASQVPDMATRQQAVELARELHLTDSHVFFGDWVDYQEWPNYLLEADVGVSLHLDTIESRFAFRTRLLDYVWAGLPMVVSRGDVLTDRVAQDDLGRVVGCQDQQQVADALLALLADPLARSRREAAFASLRQELTWERVAEPLLRFCRGLESRHWHSVGGAEDASAARETGRTAETAEMHEEEPLRPEVSDQRWTVAQRHERAYWKRIKREGYQGLTPTEFQIWHPIVQLWSLLFLDHSFDWYLDKTVVEIGCGPFGVISGLKAGRKIGVDPLLPAYRDLWNLKAHNCEYLPNQGEEISLPDRTADVVICLNVLDHVQSPAAVLSEIRRVLKEGGELFLSLDLEGQDKKCHPQRLDLEGVAGLLAHTGFRILKAHTTSALGDPGRAVHLSSVCKLATPAERPSAGLPGPDRAERQDHDGLGVRLQQAEIARGDAEAQLAALRDLVQRYEQGRFMRFMAAASRLRGRLRAATSREPVDD